jgi:hypothetical protein
VAVADPEDYISYLAYTTLVSDYTNHVVLMSSLSFQIITHTSYGALVLWYCTDLACMGSRDQILVKSIFFLSCSQHAVILHYTKNFFSKVLCFPKIYNHTSLYGPIASGTKS